MRTKCVYLLHLDPPYKHARHYIGSTIDVTPERRIEEHASGTGSRLCAVATAAGSLLVLAKIWKGKGRIFERQLKNRGGAARICPICQKEKSERITA